MSNRNRITKGAAGLAAVVAIGAGSALVAGASSGDTANSRNASGFGPPGMQAAGSQPGMPPGAQGAPPAGLGTEATGAAAAKAEAAALKKYPGTAERVMKLEDGSYVVHVVRSSGEVHVLVSSAFEVKGLEQRPQGPPPGMAPNGRQGAPPSQSDGQQPAPPSGSSSGSTPTT